MFYAEIGWRLSVDCFRRRFYPRFVRLCPGKASFRMRLQGVLHGHGALSDRFVRDIFLACPRPDNYRNGVGPFATRRSTIFLTLMIYGAFSLLSLTRGRGKKLGTFSSEIFEPRSPHPNEPGAERAPEDYYGAINVSAGAVGVVGARVLQ
jgi:hypothetical protein